VFPIARLQLRLKLLDEHAPAGYWGSRLRGGYGRVLKEQLCDHQELEDCRDCPRFGVCDYPRLFEPVRTAEESKLADAPLRGHTSLPRLFVIDIPRHFAPAQLQTRHLHFGFTLFGALCQRIEYPVAAFSIFGQMGIEAAGGRLAQFALTDVRDVLRGGRSIFDGAAFGTVTACDVLEVVRAARWTPPPAELAVRFVTPVRIERGRVRDFYELVYELCNRVGGLWQMYGADWPGQSEFYRWRNALLKQARGVKTLQSELRDFTTARYSHRQEKQLPLYGFIGQMRFAGDFAPFEDLLRVGEIVHIGQQTGFGFGRVQMVEGTR
jgi:hypothetical protein